MARKPATHETFPTPVRSALQVDALPGSNAGPVETLYEAPAAFFHITAALDQSLLFVLDGKLRRSSSELHGHTDPETVGGDTRSYVECTRYKIEPHARGKASLSPLGDAR